MTSSINKIKFNFLKTIVMVNDVLKCSLEEETERARYMLRLQREWMKVKDRNYVLVKWYLDDLFQRFNTTAGHRYLKIRDFCLRVSYRSDFNGFTYQKKVEFLNAAMKWLYESTDYYREEWQVKY